MGFNLSSFTCSGVAQLVIVVSKTIGWEFESPPIINKIIKIVFHTLRIRLMIITQGFLVTWEELQNSSVVVNWQILNCLIIFLMTPF